jgi:hypothetical protein
MPHRWLAVLIVLFWLAMTSAFFWREYWPYLQPGAPPPFAIDLTDEAHNPVAVRWKVSRNGEPLLIAFTNVTHHPATNDFSLTAKFVPDAHQARPPEAQSLLIETMESEYRVNPEGQLLGLQANIRATFQLVLDGHKAAKLGSCEALVEGTVTNGRFAGAYDLTLIKDDGEYHKEGKLPPVPVSAQGSVLMPLHPVSHVRGLRPGQSWHLPLVDPLGDSLASLVPGSQPGSVMVAARVLSDPQTLPVSATKSYECNVIEYAGDNLSARTWVRVSDSQVLRQEATLAGDSWVLQRE